MNRRKFIALVGGAVLPWQTSARSQQASEAKKIAIVHPQISVEIISETGDDPNWRVFFAELRRLGHVEGLNLAVDRQSAAGATERHAEVAREVVSRGPDLIFAISNTMARHFKQATDTIPVVTMTTDPIAIGLTASLARPTGNMTGVITDAGLQVWEKRLQLLREALPSVSMAALLLSRYSWDGAYGRAVREMATRVGVPITPAALGSPIQEIEYRRVFAMLRQEHVAALLINESAENFTHRRLIVELVNDMRLPAIYPYREYVDLGGLMAYATDIKELMRRAVGQIDQILTGLKPAEVPYYQATKFELVINLKCAKALGLTIPPTLLARADEVIE